MGENATIKDRIRQLRTARGWSQQELADKLGVTNVAVSQWERGVKHPKMEMREALCDLFNVNIEYLNGNWDKISRLLTEDEAEMIDDNRIRGYYLNDETAYLANELKNNPGLRLLFDAGKDMPPEDIIKTLDFIKNTLNKSDD